MMAVLEQGAPPESTGTLTVPAELERLDDVLELVHAELERRDCPISVQNKLDIVIEELFVNVCSYAYQDRDERGDCRVEYAYSSNPHTITLSITDWGIPFDPFAREDPVRPKSVEDAPIGGLGIFMVKQLCDGVRYLRDGDKNVVVIGKTW